MTNLLIEDPLLGTLGKGAVDFDMANDAQAWEKWEAWTKFKNTPYEMQAYEKPVWKRADQLARGDMVLGLENKWCVVEQARPMYRIKDSDHAWVQAYAQYDGWEAVDEGICFDLTQTAATRYTYHAAEHRLNNDEMLLSIDEDGRRHYPPYVTTVYNIEVEDYSTYCVGRSCILVQGPTGDGQKNQL